MEAKRILTFLADVAANNTREWFQEHREEYNACRASFEDGITRAIAELAHIDKEIAHLQVKDCVYRFNRDTRFSPDKSPYKNHLGAYICAHGKKSLRGGYYLHLEPGHCMVAVGCYWLPTNILTSCRNELMGNIADWRKAVENKDFVELFGKPGEGSWEHSDKGFGLAHLKKAPAGFPKDYEFIEYLRMKDYCCWTRVPDTFFEGDDWYTEMVRICQVGKPMMDFMNQVIDDYE